MESGSVDASNKGLLVPLPTSSYTFLSEVLAPLKNSSLCEESKHSFSYTSAVLINNPELEKKYNAFRVKKRELGYTDEDLKESYGFLLFSDINKAEKLAETGVLAGNSTCKTLGDPSKGVYISQYSDRLDQNPWSHGKSGYVAIVKLTKGRLKEVSEKYTQNVTAPTKGFDCHVSKEFSTVVSNTSPFLAFQRTQCYLYEFLGDGSDEMVQCPGAVCIYAIVSFSYIDPKIMLTAQQQISQKKLGPRYFSWRGQLNIGSRYYNVGLRATAEALSSAQLPTVVKVDRAISLSDLRRVLPRTIFQTRFSSEVFLGGLYYSLCELVSSEVEQASTLSLLLQEIKAKDVALTVPLNESGFLILLPSYYFCNDDSGSSKLEFLQGIFVFPDSRVINREMFPSKFAHGNPTVSVPSNAEVMAGKTLINPSEKLTEVLEQQMQNCTSPDADGCLISVPAMTSAAWRNFSLYLQKPDSFQLPVTKASDILSPAAEKEMENIVDSVDLSMLSPDLGSVSLLTSQNLTLNKRPVDRSAEGHGGLKTSPPSVKLRDLLLETGEMERKTSPSSDDLRAELIVSFTSAEPTGSGSDSAGTEPKTRLDAFQLSGFQPEVSALGDEMATATQDLESPMKVHRGNSKGLKRLPRACHEMDKMLNEEQIPRSQRTQDDVEASDNSQLNVDINSSKAQTHQFRKVLNNKKLTVAEEKKSDCENVLMELEAYSLRRKMEHWDLKPVISKCGRILVPHGSGNVFEQIKDLRNATQSENEMSCEKIAPISMNVHDKCKPEHDANAEKVLAASPKCEENQHQNVISHGCPEHSISQQNEEIKSLRLNPHSIRNESSKAVPLPKCLSPEKPSRRMENLINRMTSVLGGKTTSDLCEKITDNPENAEFCLKRGAFEKHPGFRKSADETKEIPDAGARKEGVSTPLSVDPHFALALGLAPIAVSNKTVKSEPAGVQQKKDSRPQIVQKQLSMFPKRRRIKMLRKHQNASTESVKEKWWLHFQSPTCPEGEGLENKEAHLDREEQRSSCSPTDGLNLLADLALCATSNQLPLQPKQTPERVLTNLSCQNDDGAAEQQTVLHSLLRQPAARPIQNIQPPPPVNRVGEGELAGLITKEHAYSMHPSTSLLLGFSSMPFQVQPLSGCTRLLYHHQNQHLSVDQEEESTPQTSECTENHTLGRRRLKRSRNFTMKNGSVQVTKRWKRDYDFSLDSKFSNDPQFRTICRGLHGPWDFSVKDTTDEVRLIFHMWIALFYSRSMPRFFDFESDPYSLETPIAPISTSPQSDLKDSLLPPDPNVNDTSDALISTPSGPVPSETSTREEKSIILHLSQKNSLSDITTSVSQVIPKETCETPNTPVELHPTAQFQCYRKVYSTEIINESSIRSTATFRSSTELSGSRNKNTDICLLDSKDKEVFDGVHTESGEEESPSQEVSMETTQNQAGSSDVAEERDLLGKESVKEPELFSPVMAEDTDEGVDCCLSQDSVSKDLYPKGEDPGSYQRADQQSPMMSQSLDSVERVSVTVKNHQSSHDICFTDVHHQQLFQHNSPAMRNESNSREDDSQQRKCVVDEAHYEKEALIASHESVGLSDQSITQANGDRTQDQTSTVVDLSCSLKCDQPGEGLEMMDSRVSLSEECKHQEGAAHPREPCSDSVDDDAGSQKESPFINETATSQPTDPQKATCLQRGEPEMPNRRMSPSLYDDRCPTPAPDEEKYQYTPSSGSYSSSSASLLVDETPKPVTQKCLRKSSTLFKSKHFYKKYKTAVKSGLNPKSGSRVLKHKDNIPSAQKHTEKHSRSQIADNNRCLQRGKPQADKAKLPSQNSRLTDECFQTFKPNTGKDGNQKPPQASVEMPSCSQPRVTLAKISEGDETQGQVNDDSTFAPSKSSLDLKTSGLLEKNTNDHGEQRGRWQEKEVTSQPGTSSSNVKESNLGRTKRLPADLLHRFSRGETPELKRVVQIVGKELREGSGMDEQRIDASSSGVDYSDGAVVDDSCCRAPQGTVRCTIFNTGEKTSSTFLEQMSKRCLQEDLTQVSVEEECLIFSEQLKQILRRSKKESINIRTPAAHENIHLFRARDAAAHSCGLQDQEVRHDSPSFAGMKITVDMSDRKSKTDTTEEEISNSLQHDGISGVMARPAGPYTGKMDDICAVRKCPVRHKENIRMDSGDRRTDPSDLSDFCDIVKRESGHKNTNLVVKTCSKTKYRFYVLVTSDDPFFEETKVQLEAEGHTAVQPSEFFLAEESPSTLLIILRNEDIIEHICEVPHLLSLKKLPGVQFAGLDQPHDVLNLTHQELFVRGGFIMFERAALESLRLRDMEMVSERLQELSRHGRWKWVLHYRHSRWLKEKSRLCAEAREKKNFISWCQEIGILDVLPYHECDHLSRDQPDYLACLVHLQVQNISARYPVFITEMTTHSSFGTKGILTLTLSSFLTCKTFLV